MSIQEVFPIGVICQSADLLVSFGFTFLSSHRCACELTNLFKLLKIVLTISLLHFNAPFNSVRNTQSIIFPEHLVISLSIHHYFSMQWLSSKCNHYYIKKYYCCLFFYNFITLNDVSTSWYSKMICNEMRDVYLFSFLQIISKKNGITEDPFRISLCLIFGSLQK